MEEDSAVIFADFSNKNVWSRDILYILIDYEKLVNKAMEIARVMQAYINVSGKWNDDNANTIAEWWNKDSKKVGKLSVDVDNGISITSGDNPYCGENRIKDVLCHAAYLFWVTICRPLYAVCHDKNEVALDGEPLLKLCYEKGKQNFTINDFKNNLYFQIFMTQLNGQNPKYESVTLPLKNVSGGSNAGQISEFFNEISGKLKEFMDLLDDYKKILGKFSGDGSKIYFGITGDDRPTEAKNKLNQITYDNINSFKNDLTEAVSGYSKMISQEFADYLATPFIEE